MRGLTNIEGIYFLGIGGIGMSNLARYFLSEGFVICGYDRTATALTERLEEEGCSIVYDDDPDALPALFSDPEERDRVLIVYTPAIPKESPILNYFRDNGYDIHKRAEILGMISRETDAIAVAGTHGKTTVSTMIAHILTSSEVKCSAFLGWHREELRHQPAPGTEPVHGYGGRRVRPLVPSPLAPYLGGDSHRSRSS